MANKRLQVVVHRPHNNMEALEGNYGASRWQLGAYGWPLGASGWQLRASGGNKGLKMATLGFHSILVLLDGYLSPLYSHRGPLDGHSRTEWPLRASRWLWEAS